MQELKFKVFYEPSGKIYDVLAMDFVKKGITVEYKKSKTQVVGMDFCKIMQYTGLKDINGREIYEGDTAIGGMRDTAGKVLFDEQVGAYVIEFNYGVYHVCDCVVEVIGNIYENPELLE